MVRKQAIPGIQSQEKPHLESRAHGAGPSEAEQQPLAQARKQETAKQMLVTAPIVNLGGCFCWPVKTGLVDGKTTKARSSDPKASDNDAAPGGAHSPAAEVERASQEKLCVESEAQEVRHSDVRDKGDEVANASARDKSPMDNDTRLGEEAKFVASQEVAVGSDQDAEAAG